MKFLFAALMTIASGVMMAWFIFMDAGGAPLGHSMEISDETEVSATSVDRVESSQAINPTNSGKNQTPNSVEPGAVEVVQDSLLAITVDVENQSANAFGSGVIVGVSEDAIDVLTASHVLDVQDLVGTDLSLTVRLNTLASVAKREFQSVQVLRRDDATDLALLRVEMPEGSGALSHAAVFQGDEQDLNELIDQIGWAIDGTDQGIPDQGIQETLSPAVWQTRIEAVEKAKTSAAASANVYLRVETASASGMSGGGLFRFPSGQEMGPNAEPILIGLASGNSGEKAYYVAGHLIREFLLSTDAKKSL